MKRLVSLAGSFALIIIAVFSAMGAIISAFSFPVDMVYLFWIWLTAALAFTTLSTFLRVKGVLILSLSYLAVAFLKLPEILDGAKWVASFITVAYNKWIDIPVLFPDATQDTHSITLFFAAAGVFVACLLTIAICIRRSTFLTVLFTLPFVFLTFVLTSYQPNFRLLLELLSVYLTVLISSSLYPNDFIKRGLAVFPSLAISIVLLAVTYLLTMTGGDRRGELINLVDTRLRSIGAQTGFTRINFGSGWPAVSSDIWRFDTELVRVSDAGPRSIEDQNLLEITSTRAGSYYLRGYSMQLFDGRAWHTNADAQRNQEDWLSRETITAISILYDALNPDKAQVSANMEVAVTGDNSNIQYLPYYTSSYTGGNPNMIDFHHSNDSIPGLYAQVPYDVIEAFAPYHMEQMRQMAVRIESTYTKVDETTAEGLITLARDAGIDPAADRTVIADAVASYISSSARYTLSPFPIPDEEDFALYFLRTSRQGYCIHFATAATLMLRALGVPARFTSGFVVSVPNGKTLQSVTVTDRHAHAWVEVFYDNIGWIPLEVTPAGSGIPVGRPHTSFSGSRAENDAFDDLSPDWMPGVDPGTITAPSASQAPSTDTQEEPAPVKRGGVILIVCFSFVAALVMLIVRQFVVSILRSRRLTQADTNAAVISAWRYISRVSRKNPPPYDIEYLALRARFSQHKITEDERAYFMKYTSALTEEMYKKYYLPGRLWLKYILLY